MIWITTGYFQSAYPERQSRPTAPHEVLCHDVASTLSLLVLSGQCRHAPSGEAETFDAWTPGFISGRAGSAGLVPFLEYSQRVLELEAAFSGVFLEGRTVAEYTSNW